MALKKPLVISSGQVQQLQSGDTLDAPMTAVDIVVATNSNAGAIVIGSPVYPDGNDSVDLGKADASGTVELLGLVRDTTIGIAGSGEIQTDGVLAATTGQWDAVTGDSGGLTAGTVYYLDPSTAGMLTDTAPSTAGQFVVRVGLATSTTEMEIGVEPPIKL